MHQVIRRSLWLQNENILDDLPMNQCQVNMTAWGVQPTPSSQHITTIMGYHFVTNGLKSLLTVGSKTLTITQHVGHSGLKKL